MSEENKAIVRRCWEEFFSKENAAILDELASPDYINHDPGLPDENRSRDGFKQFATMLRAAFPDFQWFCEAQYAEGDTVVTRWSNRGTHKGELMGIPATGKEVGVTGISIDRLEGGRIVETWANWDTLGWMQQIEAVPG